MTFEMQQQAKLISSYGSLHMYLTVSVLEMWMTLPDIRESLGVKIVDCIDWGIVLLGY